MVEDALGAKGDTIEETKLEQLKREEELIKEVRMSSRNPTQRRGEGSPTVCVCLSVCMCSGVYRRRNWLRWLSPSR